MTGCDAIHPGYGFLSEDETFAEVVRAHGLTFIGPPPEVLDRFASKEATRRLLGGYGLPTIPGSDGMLRDDAHALEEAERIGYPVLIKPCAGGGGKGMRMVRSRARARAGDQGLPIRGEGRPSATTRSTSRSGSRTTATSRSRSPSTGSATGSTSASATAPSSAATRRSSRRRPTPALSPAARAELAERAIRAVVAAGYENVGTLEFLVDGNGNFYFIEINCRIQVEHPVTEMLTGIDLVATQIRIAAGEPLGFSQADVELRGHAIELRINAEDVDHDFRPSAGVVERYLAPGRPRRPDGLAPVRRLRGPAVLRLAARQAHRLGPRPRSGDRPGPGGPRRAGRRRARHERRRSTGRSCATRSSSTGG